MPLLCHRACAARGTASASGVATGDGTGESRPASDVKKEEEDTVL
jgi:hypothetical protein